MSQELSAMDYAKFATAKRAAAFVESGMRVGLGTGSTAAWLVKVLGQQVREQGLKIKAVPTSTRTAELARQVGIDVVGLDEAGWLDLTIDGADEFDTKFNLIKGGGGALLQEKIVATASDRMVVIADAAKNVGTLGAFPLPVEVTPFGWQTTQRLVEKLIATQGFDGCDITLRTIDGAAFVTDEGNHIIDLHLGRLVDPPALAAALNQIAGVVETGLFIDICDKVVIGHGDGKVELLSLGDSAIVTDQVDIREADHLAAAEQN